MATIKSFNIVPPGGWRYVQPETAARFSADDYDDLKRQVKVHREYKGFPVDQLDLDIQRQLCSGMSTEWCKPEPGEDHRPVRDLTSELTTGMAISLGKAITAFVAGGGQLVEKSEAEARAVKCRGCPFNKPAQLCSCSAVYTLVEALIPKDRKYPGISVCMACGCSLQAKVNLPLEVIGKSLPPDLVLPPWCWQRDSRHPLES
jgi:hypothetical protein